MIDKPAGLVVHPAAGNRTGTLVNALIAHCGASLSGIGGEKRPGIVHRLDKDTSGLLVVAKTDRAHRALAAQFADHGRQSGLERGYLALVWGVPDPREGTIDKPIGRDPKSRVKMAVRAGGRRAVTHYKTRAVYRDAKGKPVASLVECRLETGRTHQIRVHLAKIGHPLLGDAVYGAGFRTRAALLSTKAKRALAAFERQALHAYLLGFVHPLSGETLQIRAKSAAGLRLFAKHFHVQVILPPLRRRTRNLYVCSYGWLDEQPVVARRSRGPETRRPLWPALRLRFPPSLWKADFHAT